jgi:EpsI family protein
VTLLLASTVIAARVADYRPPEMLQHPLEEIPSELAGFRAVVDNRVREDLLAELAPTEYLSRTYRRGKADLRLFVAYYARQKAGESMHSPKNCLPGSGWEIWTSRPTVLPGTATIVNQYSIRRELERLAIFYWYQSRDRVIANEFMGKFLLIRDAVLAGRTSGALVTITVEDTPEMTTDAARFAALLLPEVEACFRP